MPILTALISHAAQDAVLNRHSFSLFTIYDSRFTNAQRAGYLLVKRLEDEAGLRLRLVVMPRNRHIDLRAMED